MSVVTCNLNSQLIQNCTSELKLQNSSEAMHFILDVNCSETVCSCDYSFFSQNFLSLGIFSTSSCPFFRFFDDVLLINDFLLKKLNLGLPWAVLFLQYLLQISASVLLENNSRSDRYWLWQPTLFCLIVKQNKKDELIILRKPTLLYLFGFTSVFNPCFHPFSWELDDLAV